MYALSRSCLGASLLILVLGGVLSLPLAGQEAHPPVRGGADTHTPLRQVATSLPSIDASKISQEYKALPLAKYAVARDVAKTADTVGLGAARVVNEQMDARQLKTSGSTPIQIGDKWFCTYRLEHEGIPLAKTSDAMCVVRNNGQAVMLRERNIPTSFDATKPTVETKAASDYAGRQFKESTKADKANLSEPVLEIWVNAEKKGILCWVVVVTNGSDANPLAVRYWIAATGAARVLGAENLIHHDHDGLVTGDAWSTSSLRPTSKVPLGFCDATRTGGGGGTRPTGMDGRYVFSPGFGTVNMKATLAGQYSVIEDKSGGTVLTRNQNGTNPINLDFNTTTPNEIAQVSAFQGVNVVHDFARQFLLPSHLFQLPTRVNINSTCNAYFSGGDVSINFFKAGGGCPNTAYSDVIYHEYGHAIDFSLGGILDGGYSEGFGDSVAMLITRQPCVGRDFFGAGTCLRDYATINTTWPPSSPEVHFVGQIYGGFVHELIQQLDKDSACSKGEDAYAVAKRLVLAAAAGNPKDIPDAVYLSFLADDDDGDLSNGTPHFLALAAAADSRHIPRPANPTSLLPRIALHGSCGTHHLAEAIGTAFYCWDGVYWLTTLKHDKSDANYFYYCEQEYPDYHWAFSRTPDYCGEYLVWLLPGNETAGNWICFQPECGRIPINANPQAAASFRK
jgi:hypothetical protein